jgi:hypothetical protein
MTAWLTIAAAALAIAVIDTLLYVRYGTPATITGVLNQAYRAWPATAGVTAFAMGALFGHLFL